jgi:hypothetical protein
MRAGVTLGLYVTFGKDLLSLKVHKGADVVNLVEFLALLQQCGRVA